MFLPENLKLLRVAAQLKQEEVAAAVGISRSMIVAYEKGDSTPSLDTLNQLSALLRVSLDTLVNNHLGKLSASQLQQVIAAPDAFVRGQTLRIRDLVRSLGTDNKENIELVPAKAAMGYCQGGFSDEAFIGQLPIFRLPLPFLSDERKYRLFPAGGESMLPIPSNSYVLGEYVTNWYELKQGTGCIVISNEGIVLKKVHNELRTHQRLVLHSLNPAYEPFAIAADQIRELWKYVLYISSDFPDAEPSLSTVLGELRSQRQVLGELKSKFERVSD